MPDIPGNSTTTASIGVGQTIVNTLETPGDRDWFRINLTAGQSISVSLHGITLQDSYLRIYDSSGTLLYENDDISTGINLDSLVAFSANYTGVYYIAVGAWNDGYAGDYQLSVTTYTPPPLWTNDQIANQLVEGYWSGDDHHFNVTQGGTITVNLTGLTPDGQNLARAALQEWSDIIGVTFREVTTGGQIVFDDNESGAFATANYSGGITTSARINVSTQWLTDYGTSLGGYAFQSYVHEIGHALGLGHAGNYNNDARYPYDALYQNDSWATTIMSYFDQRENTYFAGQGFTQNFAVTPMVADILAMSTLYGLSTTTRTGDTTYGFNSTAGRDVFNATLYPRVAYTIFDSGGNDTLDYSGFSANQRIDLNPETFSNVGGRVGNVSIARGVIIENAIGGSGSDTIIGNSANNYLQGGLGNDTLIGGLGADILTGGSGADSLTGGAGADLFRDTLAGLSGDTIADFASDDRIIFTDANIASFTFSLSGQVLTYSGGSLTIVGGVTGQMVARSASGGGVELVYNTGVVQNDARNDFNGDGYSDILWRNDAGTIGTWLGTNSANFTVNSTLVNVPNDWRIVGIGDFNGDHRDDILWRNSSGTVGDWLGSPSGDFAVNNSSLVAVPVDWQVAGVGDFNGDGRDDILWRHSSGTIGDWLGTSTGSFTVNNSSMTSVPLDWQVVGVGDFNGDGRDDILWRNSSGLVGDWLGTASGGFAVNGGSIVGVPVDWHVIGVGDFNGDHRDDILWRNDSGTVGTWLGTASGGFTVNNGSLVGLGTNWHVADVGDYNGDGRDDLMLRNDAGGYTEWLGTASGGFAATGVTGSVSLDWHIQSPDHLWM